MRKHYLLTFAAMLMAVPQLALAVDVPYSSTIATGPLEYDTQWSIQDGTTAETSDGISWMPHQRMWDNGLQMRVRSNSYAPKDDWLVSPAISLQKDVPYLVKLTYNCGSAKFPESLAVYMDLTGEPAKLITTTKIIDLPNFTSTNDEVATVQVTPEQDGLFHFGIHACSEADMYDLCVRGFSVEVDPSFGGGDTGAVIPEPVSGLTATRNPYRLTEVTLSWRLPTKDVNGSVLTSDAKVDRVHIYRDETEVPIVTLTDNLLSFTDKAADTGLEPGVHTYRVVACVGDQASQPASVTTEYVGPAPQVTAPVNMEIPLSNSDFTRDWTVLHFSETPVSWTLVGGIAVLYSVEGVAQDDWLVSPQVLFPEAGKYEVTIDTDVDDPSKRAFVQAFWGDQISQSLFSDAISETFDYSLRPESGHLLVKCPVTVEKSETRHIALHAFASGSSMAHVYVYGINVEKVASEDSGVAEILADQPVSVFSTDGKLLFSAPAFRSADLPAGLYIVRQGSRSFKVAR